MNSDQITVEARKGHPSGLWNLAGVEMWERFSFYGMQAILAFYLYYSVTDGGLGLTEAAAVSIVGAYGGLVYLSAVLGAWIADRLLGSERTLFYGAILIMCGHIALAAVPGLIGVGIGLICVAVGAGTLKATTSSVLGEMYTGDDNRRDAGFSIYYMGVNLGALIGPLLTGWLWGMKGFHWGFAAAAVGMGLGLIQYVLLRRRTIGDIGKEPTNPLPAEKRMLYIVGAIVAVALIALLAAFGLLPVEHLANIVTVVTAVTAVVLFAVILTSKKITSDERSRVISFIPMFLASATFWSLFQQQFTVLAVYSDKRLDRNLFGFEMSPAWVNSINPVFIIIFAGVFAAMWTKLGDRQPSTPLKFAAGTFLMGAAFLLFIPFANGEANSTPLLWIVLILFFFTMAELFLSPVGQSLSTKLAPKAFHTQMIALFFLSVALGSSMAGTMAGFYDETNEVPYFLIIGGASIVVALIMVVLNRWILKMMRGVR
ncbi:peptide MFS transporter [Tessaracoccus sp. HDW20]|uniref:peptide MFS transporter n=1 Tax=Tessaracoccus coleopterorum TaxID=2714950 RepID=UPI0018D3235F|nr:peptide MFS transporter [Tessaracoccus coleopterorum]NHB83926.1 peptide MFS transporter [Tessaracoccus coleopterorum]